MRDRDSIRWRQIESEKQSQKSKTQETVRETDRVQETEIESEE